jgi:hypothetical protein
MKYYLICLLLTTCCNLTAQNDSIAFIMPFYFEDAVGNRDTVFVGASEYGDGTLNPEWGEINTFSTPFDSVFEVRLTPTREFLDSDERILETFSKTLIVEYNDFGTIGDCSIVLEAPTFVVNALYPPVTVSWDQDLFSPGNYLGCAKGTFIVNTLAPYSIEAWYDAADLLGFDYYCLAGTTTATITPWEGEFPGGPGYNDFAVHHIEGSTNAMDTLMAMHLFWARTTAEPCFTIVDTDDFLGEINPPLGAIYPNPVSDRLYLPVTDNIELVSVVVSSLEGRLLFSNDSRPTDIDVSDWPPGMYILHYRTKQGETGAQRFIKQ